MQTLRPEGGPLENPELVLFIHDHQAQFGKLNILLDQGMRPDDDLNLSRLYAFQGFGPLPGRGASFNHHGLNPYRFQQGPQGQEVLLRENFGGSHERRLVP